MYENTKLRSVLSAVFLILLDQFTKYKIRTSGGFYICNKGIAFGIDWFWIFLILLIITIIFFILQISNSPNCLISNKIPKFKYPIITLDIRHFIRNWKLEIGTLLILSGALSNMIDRVLHSCVIDFIDLHFWPVFNLADIYITIGAALLVMSYKVNRVIK
jgi:lipoprotein signal peptidase